MLHNYSPRTQAAEAGGSQCKDLVSLDFVVRRNQVCKFQRTDREGNADDSDEL